MKIFTKNRKNNKTNRAFALLFAVMISSIVLAVGMGVANIAYKEITFSASATAANDAFSAADTGVECALYWDKGTPEFPQGIFGAESESGAAICMGSAIDGSSDQDLDPSSEVGTWMFQLIRLGTDGRSCAVVTVTKDDSYVPTQTRIVSKGYNLGGDDDEECFSLSQNRVERQLEVTY